MGPADSELVDLLNNAAEHAPKVLPHWVGVFVQVGLTYAADSLALEDDTVALAREILALPLNKADTSA